MLSQTYSNFEIIISDNASTDDTPLICKEYLNKDSRIRYIRQKTNIGGIENLNLVFKEARGEYFMLAADDDYWHPDFVSRLEDILEKNSDYAMAMCSLGPDSDNNIKEHKFVGDRDVTNLSHPELFYHIAAGCGKNRNKDLMFVCGLWRREFLAKFVYRPLFVECKAPERLLLGEMALITKFYTIPDFLWIKGQASKERREAGKPIYKGDSYAHSYYRYLILLLIRILSSRNLSVSDKLVFLRHYPKVVWDVKNYIFYRDMRSFRIGREMLYPSLRRIKRFFLRF